MAIKVEAYETVAGNSPVADYMARADEKARKKMLRHVERLEREGFNLLGTKIFEKIKDDIYELKIPYHRIQHRIICGWHNATMWLLHAFPKKTPQLRAADISTAENRLRELKSRR